MPRDFVPIVLSDRWNATISWGYFFMEQIEEWRLIPGTKGRYEASSLGKIRGIKRTCSHRFGKRTVPAKLISPHLIWNGYLQLNLAMDDKKYHPMLVHRLIAIAFHPNPEKRLYVNHKNGIKTDNRATNLEWVTGSENANHAFINKLRKSPSRADHPLAKKLIDLSSGIVYDSILEFREAKGIQKHTFYNHMFAKGKLKTMERFNIKFI